MAGNELRRTAEANGRYRAPPHAAYGMRVIVRMRRRLHDLMHADNSTYAKLISHRRPPNSSTCMSEIDRDLGALPFVRRVCLLSCASLPLTLCVCVCVCVCARARACMYVFVGVSDVGTRARASAGRTLPGQRGPNGEADYFESELGRTQLKNVLTAYAALNPTVGYCQSEFFALYFVSLSLSLLGAHVAAGAALSVTRHPFVSRRARR